MIIRNLGRLFLLAISLTVSLQLTSASVDVTTARATACSFLRMHATSSQATFNVPSVADIRLAHAEPSSVIAGVNDYYAFNITGGGFIIVAGEETADTWISTNCHTDLRACLTAINSKSSFFRHTQAMILSGQIVHQRHSTKPSESIRSFKPIGDRRHPIVCSAPSIRASIVSSAVWLQRWLR